MIIEDNFVKISLRNGIIIFIYKERFITLEVAKHCVARRLEFQNGEDLPVLCDMRNILFSEVEARNFLSSVGSIAVKALALLTNSYTEDMANIYLGFYPQPVPTGVFTDEQEALDFLEVYK